MIIKNLCLLLIILEAKNAEEFLFRITSVFPVKNLAAIVITAQSTE